ncbi:mannose-6-phosphate isomerase [Ktedonobacteria bacterium brp13]|nr:mannose-6-phosphate isomerase [Ktedonobacteria bacterium brp13]
MSTRETEHTSSQERSVRIIKPNQFDSNTAQTEGMKRAAAISHDLAGADKIWAGLTTVDGHTATGKHHHGELETIIYVKSGSIKMQWGDNLEFAADAEAGDFVYVPPFIPHKEINAGSVVSEWVIVRNGRDPIVVNLEPANPAEQQATDTIHGH